MKIMLKLPLWSFFEKLYRETDGVSLTMDMYNILIFLTVIFLATALFFLLWLCKDIYNVIDKNGIKPIRLSGRIIDKKTNDVLFLVVETSNGVYRVQVSVRCFFMYSINDDMTLSLKVSRLTRKAFDMKITNPIPNS